MSAPCAHLHALVVFLGVGSARSFTSLGHVPVSVTMRPKARAASSTPSGRREAPASQLPRREVVSDVGLLADVSPFHKVPMSTRVLLPVGGTPAFSWPLHHAGRGALSSRVGGAAGRPWEWLELVCTSPTAGNPETRALAIAPTPIPTPGSLLSQA